MVFTEVLLIELQINAFFFFRSATTKKIQSMSIFHLLSKRLHFRKANTDSLCEEKKRRKHRIIDANFFVPF